jgi:hypothetical protein
LSHLAEDLARLLLLITSQMFPSLHAIEHAQLLLRRKVREMLESLSKLLLPFRRQTMECGIVLQGALLF